LAKLEKKSDMQISTLSKIIKALGGELEVRAKFPKGVVKIDQFTPRQCWQRTANRLELPRVDERG
jgi:hypothetical protein